MKCIFLKPGTFLTQIGMLTIYEDKIKYKYHRFLFNVFSKDVTDPYVSGYLDTTKVIVIILILIIKTV